MSQFYSIAEVNKLLPNGAVMPISGMIPFTVTGLTVLNSHPETGCDYPLPAPKGVARSDSGNNMPSVDPVWLIERTAAGMNPGSGHARNVDITISSLTNDFRQDLSRPYAGEPECRRMHERQRCRH